MTHPEHACRPTARCWTTNGRRSFAEHDFLIGVSIDGPRELHDVYRARQGRAADLRPGDARAAAAAEARRRVQRADHASTRPTRDYPLEVYRFLRDEVGTSWIQFIPDRRARSTSDGLAISRRDPTVTDRSVPAGAVWPLPDRRSSTSGCAATWARCSCRSSRRRWRQLAGPASVRACASSNETCGTALAIEHNGDLYSCDHFVEPDYLLGNIQDTHMIELVASPQQIAVRPGQARHAAPVLPRVRRALRLPRRLPQEPLHHDAGRRAGSQLSMRRLQGVLPSCGVPHEADGRIDPARPRGKGGDANSGSNFYRR